MQEKYLLYKSFIKIVTFFVVDFGPGEDGAEGG
jgi:hypothetical protein